MGFFKNWVDGFKRADPLISVEDQVFNHIEDANTVYPESKEGGESRHPTGASAKYKEANENEVNVVGRDVFTANVAIQHENGEFELVPEKSGLKRALKGRHIQFIALGGSIGTGLFIGSGFNLATGGPGSLMIAYLIVAVMMICTVYALGELAAVLPVEGSFATYAARFIDSSWGFAMGWNYWLQWLVAFPLEATAATMVIRFWDKGGVVPQGVWVAIFIVIIVIINLFGVRGYGEYEFIAALIKVLGCIGFIICAIVIDCGGSPSGKYLGAQGWHTQPAFMNGFKGFCSVFIIAAFAFSGTELVGLAAAETANPRKELPKACRQVIFRVLIFYILSLMMITLIVPATTPELNGASNDPSASPFVIAIEIGQIHALPQIFNAVILISALSVGNASIYGSSRMLQSLAEQGMAPKFFAYVDREGRPLPSIVVSLLFGLLGFLVYSSSPNTVFNWLISISGLSAVFAWASICFVHIRFRLAWLAQGNSLSLLPWASPLGIIGSWVGFILNILVIIGSFYAATWPIGEGDMNGSDRANSFFINMLSLPITLLFFIVHKIWKRTSYVKSGDIDLQTGRRDPVSAEVLEQERAEARARPIYLRIFDAVF